MTSDFNKNTSFRYPNDLLDKTRKQPLPWTLIEIVEFRQRNFVWDRGKAKDVNTEKKTHARIALPLPENPISDSKTMNWEMANMQALKILDNASQGDLKAVASGMNAMILGGINRIVASKTANPKKQALFEGHEPRTFTLDYTFFPQSLQEAETLGKLIRTLSEYALPEAEEGEGILNEGLQGMTQAGESLERLVLDKSAFFKFPAEFMISFNNVRGFPKYMPAVCTNISTNLGSQIQLFESGHSVQVNLSMSFLETELLRRGNPGV